MPVMVRWLSDHNYLPYFMPELLFSELSILNTQALHASVENPHPLPLSCPVNSRIIMTSGMRCPIQLIYR